MTATSVSLACVDCGYGDGVLIEGETAALCGVCRSNREVDARRALKRVDRLERQVTHTDGRIASLQAYRAKLLKEIDAIRAEHA